MTAAIDGTYWRVKWLEKGYGFSGDTLERKTTIFPTKELAIAYCENLKSEPKENEEVTCQKFRNPMSIVRAVKLITEARKQGVVLWMSRLPPTGYRWTMMTNGGYFVVSNGQYEKLHSQDVRSRWIVATPDDARKIDKRKR